MTKITRLFIVTLVLAFSTFHVGKAQELEDFVSAYTGENGRMYLQPLGDALGANLSSNLFHSAKIPKMKFNIELSIATATVFISNNQRTFEATPDASFTPANPSEVPVTVPTVFGSTQSVTLAGEGGTATSFPGGVDLNAVPIAVPQLRVGSVFGTDFTVRYFGIDLGDELGSLSLFGFGIRHSISQYLPDAFPVQLAAGYYNHSLALENFSETSASLINIQGSKKFGLLMVYSALGYESADTNFNYTSSEADGEVNLDLDTSNSLRFTLGAALKLGPLFVNADYNLGMSNVVSVGLGFSIGQ